MQEVYGTRDAAYVKIFSTLTFDQLQEVSRSYERLFNSSLMEAVESEFIGDLELALTSLLCDPIDLFCKKLKVAVVGMGTDEDVINRIIGGSGKARVKKIANRYFEKYDKNLAIALGGN
jgi:annexin A7/11